MRRRTFYCFVNRDDFFPAHIKKKSRRFIADGVWLRGCPWCYTAEAAAENVNRCEDFGPNAKSVARNNNTGPPPSAREKKPKTRRRGKTVTA